MNNQQNNSPFMWCAPLLPAGPKDGNALQEQSTATFMEIPNVNAPGHMSLGTINNHEPYSQVRIV